MQHGGKLDPLDTPRDRRDPDTEAMKVLRQVSTYVGRIEALEEQRGEREREQADSTAQLQHQVDDVGVVVVGAVEQMDSRLAKLEQHCSDSTSAFISRNLPQAPTSPPSSTRLRAIEVPPGTHPLIALVATRPVLSVVMLALAVAFLILVALHGGRLSTFVPGWSSPEPSPSPSALDTSSDSST